MATERWKLACTAGPQEFWNHRAELIGGLALRRPTRRDEQNGEHEGEQRPSNGAVCVHSDSSCDGGVHGAGCG